MPACSASHAIPANPVFTSSPKTFTAKKAPSHLYLVGNIYYYRFKVPTALVAHMGKKEIRVSLRVAYLHEARKKAALLHA